MSGYQALLILIVSLVAALQRLSVTYGYRGCSWERSCRDAYYAGIGVALVATIFILACNVGRP